MSIRISSRLTRSAALANASVFASIFASLFASLPAQAVTVTAVHSFGDTAEDGLSPLGGVTLAADGALYGTTRYGGRYGVDPLTNSGNGTIFRVTPDGIYASVYSFTHLSPASFGNSDGRWPNAGLLAAPDGWLYGVAPYGGKSDGGTVFKFSPTDGLKPLHPFSAQGDDPKGSQPQAALALGLDGRLYGTTYYGGVRPPNDGTVFSLNTEGRSFRVLTSFGQAGQLPSSRLLAASDGMLYGILRSYRGSAGGALFRIAPDGTRYSVLHKFDYASEGGFFAGSSMPGLVEGPDGYLYGATADGGPADAGAVYRVARDGTQFTILHAFADTDGSKIHTSLVLGRDGNLYGASAFGGKNDNGTVFRMAIDGSGFTTLYNFPKLPNPRGEQTGAGPFGDIAFNARGQLCGTASLGGAFNLGTVFCLTLDVP